jgi:outer membrane protein
MKKGIKFFLLTIILFSLNGSLNADDKFFFIDMNYIFFNSTAGNKISKKIQSDTKKISAELSSFEQKVEKQRKEIINQKNVLSDDELKKKSFELGKKVKDYNQIIINKNKELNQYKNKAKKNFYLSLTDVVQEYASDNSIEMVLKKENVLIGKKNLDITQKILAIFNKKVKNVIVN